MSHVQSPGAYYALLQSLGKRTILISVIIVTIIMATTAPSLVCAQHPVLEWEELVTLII